MSVWLLVTAGTGPGECRLAVGHVLDRMAEAPGVSLDVARRAGASGPASAVVHATGPGAEGFSRDWCGTVLWRCPSPLRLGYRRKRWFVGVMRLDAPPGPVRLDPRDVTIETLRAGGSGGQHVNTTDSAVRARWRAPDGVEHAVVVRDGRSQHMNRKLALQRLEALVAGERAEAAAAAQGARHGLHRTLERGNPVRVFDGPDFREA